MSGISTDIVFFIDNDWIQINISRDFWLDVAEFEKVFQLVKGKKVQELSSRYVKMLEYAISLYQGDLLEGCYQDWCIFERERFQTMHLILLDKLVQFCELHQNYEAGLTYGLEILRQDHAYERTHRQLMRLYLMAGNRSQALHQYERCVVALREELGVEPSERTKHLYQQIRLGQFEPTTRVERKKQVNTKIHTAPTLKDILHRLEEVSEAVARLENNNQKGVMTMDDAAGA
jgi:DNA-binding SARP family transcriptional activator